VTAEYGIETVAMECTHSAQAGREAAAGLIGDRPGTTAVLALDEFVAVGLVSGLNRLGRAVPADVSVLSLLTSREMGALSGPELSIM
jgi:DNA-binding LacI/PurR family transcriptional regulator